MKFLLLQTLRLASQATSLYTREAHYRPTVHLKGVTHYTLQGKACEKEYEQMPVLLLFFRQVKPALWKAPLAGAFLFSTANAAFAAFLRDYETDGRQSLGKQVPNHPAGRLDGAEFR